MRTKRPRAPLSLLLTALLLCSLAACLSNTGTDGREIAVYYVKNSYRQGDSTVLDTLTRTCPEGRDLITFAVEQALNTPDTEGYLSAAPEGSELIRYHLSGGVLQLMLSPAFDEDSGIQHTLTTACLVMTLTGLEGIDSVQFLSALDAGRESPLWQPADFLFAAVEPPTSDLILSRFYTDEAGRYGLAEVHTITLREGDTLEQYMMEELIAGPRTDGLYPVMPEGTQLLGLFREGELCTVNLSRAFTDNMAPTALAQRTTLCALVATLTQVDGLESVLLQVEGQPLTSYGGLDCSEPLRRDSYFLSVRGLDDTSDITFRMPGTVDGLLHPVPVTLARDTTGRDVSPEEGALELLCRAAPALGLGSALPEGARVLDVYDTVDGYTVNFAAGFTLTEPPAGAETALQAIVHLLCEFKPDTVVYFMVDGAALTQYYGIDLSGGLRPNARLLAD